VHSFEPQVQAILDAMPFSNLKPDDEEADDGNAVSSPPTLQMMVTY